MRGATATLPKNPAVTQTNPTQNPSNLLSNQTTFASRYSHHSPLLSSLIFFKTPPNNIIFILAQSLSNSLSSARSHFFKDIFRPHWILLISTSHLCYGWLKFSFHETYISTKIHIISGNIIPEEANKVWKKGRARELVPPITMRRKR